MEAVLTPYTMEQSIAPNRKIIRIKTPFKKGHGYSISNHSENFELYAGLLNHPPPPPSRAMSLSNPLSTSFFNHQFRQNQQPPLLPLPNVQQQPPLSRSRSSQGLSFPQSSRKNRTSRDVSLTPKKSKPTKREEVMKKRATQSISEFLIGASENRSGPDPNDLPKHLPVVLTPSSTTTALTRKAIGTVPVENMDDMFSGSIFNLSPPPSSLPIPKFSLRSKPSCNTEAAGVDTGATNNLRRLLRLR